MKRKNIHHLARNRAICNCYKEFAALRLRYVLFVTSKARILCKLHICFYGVHRQNFGFSGHINNMSTNYMSVINLSSSSSEDNLNPKYPNSGRSRKEINCLILPRKILMKQVLRQRIKKNSCKC
jgi:hypothetical protein